MNLKTDNMDMRGKRYELPKELRAKLLQQLLEWYQKTKKTELEFYPMAGYTDYEISKNGMIRRISTGTYLKPHLNHDGYPSVNLVHPKIHSRRIHRMLMLTFVPNPNNYDQINHIDGNKANFSLDNLEWCNQSMNQKHAYDNGLNHGLLGQANPKAKLTDHDVVIIRRMLKLGIVQRLVGQVFGIAEDNIGKISRGIFWTHVPMEETW